MANLGLQTFTLADLAQFTYEGVIPNVEQFDHWLFSVGHDDVHGVLDYLLARITRDWVGNMFGYDDPILNMYLMKAAENPGISSFTTLDARQGGGVHEAQILASNAAEDAVAYNAHFALINSSTGQISHTKGGVADDMVGFEGSTNWSVSGEGTFLTGYNKPGGPGYKAQNNTLMVFTDKTTIARFKTELMREHVVAHIKGGTLTAAT